MWASIPLSLEADEKILAEHKGFLLNTTDYTVCVVALCGYPLTFIVYGNLIWHLQRRGAESILCTWLHLSNITFILVKPVQSSGPVQWSSPVVQSSQGFIQDFLLGRGKKDHARLLMPTLNKITYT